MKVGYLHRSCYMNFQKEIEFLLEIPICRLEKTFTGDSVEVQDCSNHFIIIRQTTSWFVAYGNFKRGGFHWKTYKVEFFPKKAMLLGNFAWEKVLSTLLESFEFLSSQRNRFYVSRMARNKLRTGMVSEGFLSGISGALSRSFHIN